MTKLDPAVVRAIENRIERERDELRGGIENLTRLLSKYEET